MPTVPGFKPVSGPTLPQSAPRIRVTAGIGTAGQKTWNLRRPVTVIGSGRQSTIVVADPSVSKTHCVIVNTAHAVLLKDLFTQSGTLCNGRPVDLTPLNDGDVIQIADLHIQIAIQTPRSTNEQTGNGISFVDPLRVSKPVVLHEIGTDHRWTIDSAVWVAGRRPGAPIHLDHPDVSLAHALCFYFAGTPAVCDLGSRTGTWLNAKPQSIAFLKTGDRLRIGPFETHVVCGADKGVLDTQQHEIYAGDLNRREAALHARQEQLDAREAAIAARMDELRRLEEALHNREKQLAAQAQRPEQDLSGYQTPPPASEVAFGGNVGSA